jgi:hypothetical protein
MRKLTGTGDVSSLDLLQLGFAERDIPNDRFN